MIFHAPYRLPQRSYCICFGGGGSAVRSESMSSERISPITVFTCEAAHADTVPYCTVIH
jgi:hypothetical protein